MTEGATDETDAAGLREKEMPACKDRHTAMHKLRL